MVSVPTKLQTDSTGFTLESVIHIGCTPLLLLLWNPLVFRLFFAFGPYFKWILFHSKEREEKKKGRCRENGLCRAAVMKGRNMRSSVSRSVTDEQSFKDV